jgi:hypothetical protein
MFNADSLPFASPPTLRPLPLLDAALPHLALPRPALAAHIGAVIVWRYGL